MKPVRTIILGFGIRGRVYADFAFSHPNEVEIVGVADPFTKPPSGIRAWTHWKDAFSADVEADAVIIALPDEMHHEATLCALKSGYHVLLEKPIGCTWQECCEIKEAQRVAKKLVLTGYVLRYSSFYKKLREILTSGVIGNLTSIHSLNAISFGKAAHAFCRGNWSREVKDDGMLLAKCSHDFDLIAWWTKGRTCRKVASFGSRMHWRKENQPLGAGKRCVSCPLEVRAQCPFDAHKLYIESDALNYHFADSSQEAMRVVLEKSQYGRCVYECDNDVVDHQTVLMEYEGGLTVTLEMESFSKRRTRLTRFYGTRGEIIAEENTIEVRPFNGECTRITPEQEQCGAHYGGDVGLMKAFVKFVREASEERYGKILESSLVSHRLAFLAEQSRRSGEIIKI